MTQRHLIAAGLLALTARTAASETILPEVGYVSALLRTLVVLALIVAALYGAVRWGLPRLERARPSGSTHFRIAERLAVGRGKHLAIVDAAGRRYLIGIGERDVCLIDELPADDTGIRRPGSTT